MNKRVNCVTFYMLLSAATLFTLAGCQSASVNENQAQSASPTVTALLPEAMLGALVQTEEIRALSTQRESLAVSFVNNETPQYIDTRRLTEEILRGLLKANVAYDLATPPQTSKAVSPPRLRLEGVITAGVQGEAATNDLHTVHLITLRLVDGQTGEARWSDTKPLPIKR